MNVLMKQTNTNTHSQSTMVSLHLHGSHPLAERKARGLWKGHEWFEACQENGSLWNGFGTSQGYRCDQGLRIEIETKKKSQIVVVSEYNRIATRQISFERID